MATIQQLKDASKTGSWDNSIAMDDDRLQLGAILRIADATELMAADYVRMRKEKEQYERWWIERGKRNDVLQKTNSNLRGQITKLKNKINAINNRQ